MSHKPADGEFWVTQIGREWGVFWHHPAHHRWHYLLAKFDTEQRAKDYATVENDCLIDSPRYPVEPQHAPATQPIAARLMGIGPRGALVEATKRPAAAEPVSVSHPWREQLVGDLKLLFKEYPQGFGVKVVLARYGMTYLAATDALRWLHDQKLGHWVYADGHSGEKVFLPADAVPMVDLLSKKQRAVLEAMERLADQYLMVNATHRDIASEAGISANGIGSIMYALESRGFLMLACPANDGKPANYQILKTSKEASLRAVGADA